MSLFKGDTRAIKQEGDKLEDLTNSFNQNVKNIYENVEKLLTTSYVSPAARELGEKILSYRDDLDNMTKTMKDYTDFCHFASAEIAKTDRDIADNFNVKSSNFVGGKK